MLGPLIPLVLMLTGGQGHLLFDPRGWLVFIPLAMLCTGIVGGRQLQPAEAVAGRQGELKPARARG